MAYPAPNLLHDDLQITQDLRMEERQWRVQRIAWTIMTLIVLAGLLGFFGRGPLSDTTRRNDDGTLMVEWERYGRLNARMKVSVEIQPSALSPDQWQFAVDADFLRNFEIESIRPEPSAMHTGAEKTTISFERRAGDAGPARVTLFLVPQSMGTLRGEMSSAERSEPIALSTFVFP